MGKLGGFLKIERRGVPYRDSGERAHDYREFLVGRPVEELREQGARCMDCGVPFCHNGCPLGNLIPDWNDLVYHDRFADAITQLHATNNFPEFTGRLCPAPCEAACVLEIREGDAVTIKQIENSIINRAWDEGWVAPQPPRRETGRSVAVVGSGPAGMAAAQQLRRSGHRVRLFERDEAAGGLVRFGVPDFKIEKSIVERRVSQLVAEGVELRLGVDVGRDISAEELLGSHDAVVLATGSRVPRDLAVPGREIDGVHFAMDYLYQRNRWVAAQSSSTGGTAAPVNEVQISARGRRVVVIGGGDTGMDCVSNAHREGARSVVLLDVYAQVVDHGDPRFPWPLPPKRTASTYALEEGGKRRWGTEVTGFGGTTGAVTHVYARQVTGESSRDLTPVPGSEFVLEADLVLIAIGFAHPDHDGVVAQLGVEIDHRQNIRTQQTYRTSVGRVYACGDARIGQSLVVTAIAEGRKCARIVNHDLGGSPMDADRERLAVGAWSGDPDHTLRHEAETAGTVWPGEEFFTGPATRDR